MDVEMQMETNGLPTQFGLTSDRPEESHITSNLAASVSNAENTAVPPADLKQNVTLVPPTESVIPEVDLPPQSEFVSTLNGVPPQQETPIQNGFLKEITTDAQDRNTTSIPDSQPQPIPESLPPITKPESATFSTSASSLNDSVIPSSMPAEAESSQATSQPTQSIMESAPQPISLLNLAPISDLRTSPHADALTPAEVAQVEAQKHREDNAADTPTPTAGPDVMDTSFVTDPPVATTVQEETAPTATTTAVDETTSKVTNTGLATPPAQSPPAPQPQPAELPAEQPIIAGVEPEPLVVPHEQPVAPAPTPVVPEAVSEIQNDQIMEDVSTPPPKTTREREEDHDEIEPAAKRMKTSEIRQSSEVSDFKVPDIPTTDSPSQNNGTPIPASHGTSDGDDSVTAPRLAHMKKVISNLKKSNASTPFRVPVDYVSLNIPTYPDIVKNPMDLGTVDNKLKQAVYAKISDFVQDFEQIVINCVLFNGAEHGVTQQAYKMQSSFNNQMSNLPKAGLEEPSKEQKKAARTKQEPTRTAPPRRPSVSTSTPTAPSGSARSPKAAPPTPSFAVGPDGVPLIRRDSNMADGRPKRAIVPTKRNQDFAGGRPKKKKYELQLRFCQEALKEIASAKHWQINQYFTHAVDPVALNIPTYFQVIRKPMDLGLVQTNLDKNEYEKAKDFEEDVRLVFRNCYKFNPEGDFVNQCGHQLEELFNKKWATKDDWIAAREPVSEPQSDADEDEDDEEESEDDGEGESGEDDRYEKIAALQKQIELMSKQVGELTQTKTAKKKSKSPTVPPKKKSKSGKKEKSSATFPNLKKHEKKKSVSKPKPEKDRYVTFAEKQYISNGIAMLPEKQMQEALKIIQQSVPSLANSDQNEIELDIEEVPNHALLKLLNFVKKFAGPPPDEPKVETDTYAAPAVGKSKKSKPMSKQEQEAQIEELKGKLGAYAGPVSPNAMQSIETAGETSDSDGDSEESEEE